MSAIVDNSGPKKTGPKGRVDFDLHLAVAAAITPRGYNWSETELAEFCGVDHERISQIEHEAFMKLRKKPKVQRLLAELGVDHTSAIPFVHIRVKPIRPAGSFVGPCEYRHRAS